MIATFIVEFWPLIVGAIGLVLTYLLGGERARYKDRVERAEKDFEAIKRREELEDELSELSDADKRKLLAKWVREGK